MSSRVEDGEEDDNGAGKFEILFVDRAQDL